MMIRCAAGLVALLATQASGQVVTGRVTDATGTPVPHARILVRPAGDSSEAGLRAAITNDRGEFRLTAAVRGVLSLTVLRIGFRPDTGRRVDASGGSADISVTLTSIPLTLATVKVTPRAARCVSLDDREQSPDVRDLVKQGQDVLRARRAILRDYNADVLETTTRRAVAGVKTTERTYLFATYDSLMAPREEQMAGRSMGRAKLLPGGGVTSYTMPQEGTFLSPIFVQRLCFENSVFPAADGRVEVRFRQTDAGGTELGVAGTMVMTPDAAVTEITFRMLRGGKKFGEGTLTYTNVTVDNEAFPLITSHVQQVYIEMGIPNSRFTEMRDGGRTEIRYSYSPFVRQR